MPILRQDPSPTSGRPPRLPNLRRSLLQRAVAITVMAAVAVTASAPSGHAQNIPLIRDTEIEALLNDYAKPIFRAAGLGDNRIAVQIVRSDVFNAFVFDGRSVFIHTGALMQSPTPNQVIGVIAHETGHIDGAHPADLRTSMQRDATLILLLRLIGIGAAIAGGGGAAVVAGDELVMRNWLAKRRAQEGAADLAGLKYLNRTRQSGRGMLETFERFREQEFAPDAYKDPFVRSHPLASDRLAQLRQEAMRSPYFDTKDAPELQLRHDLMRAKLSGYLEPPGTVFNRYPERDQSLPARYGRAIARFFRGGDGGVEAAVREVESLIRERPTYPYFHELKGDLLMRAGRQKEAIPSLRQALKLTNGAPLVSVQLAMALVATQDAAVLTEAEGLLRRSLGADENARAFRALADIAYRLGKQPEATAAMAQAHMAEGNTKQAKIFAKRAKVGLAKGSPLWLRMDDIDRQKIEVDE